MTHTRFRLEPGKRQRYPSGWLLAKVLRSTAQDRPLELCLVCTYDDDGSDVSTHILAGNQVVLHVRGGATSWELHVSSAARDAVTLDGLDATELSHAEGTLRTAMELAAHRKWKPSDSPRLLRKAIEVVRSQGVRSLFARILGDGSSAPDHFTYSRWILAHEPHGERDLAAIQTRIEAMRSRPRFSVVMPVYNTPAKWLDRAIQSVRDQLWSDWELCIADDASTHSETREVLERHAAADARIRVVFREANGHISEASNSALAIATGEFVVLLDHDDELPKHSLYVIAEYINKHPDAVLLYSDEDKIDEEGRRFDPYFKCEWNPELFTSQNFISHLGVYRRAVVTEVGGFRKGLEGSQDYDLALRIAEKLSPNEIIHVPHVLYHWRAIPGSTALDIGEKNYAVERAKRALTDHLERQNIDAVLEPAWENAQYHRVRYSLPTPSPSVSIIIGTRDRADLLKTAIASIERFTEYSNYEIIVLDNRSEEAATKKYLEELATHSRVRVIAYDAPFNFSDMNNFGAKQSNADVYVLLNNDTEVISPGWLTELVSHAIRPDVGCVGAMLYYPDDRVQHAGVVLGMNGVAGHVFRMMRRGATGYFGRAAVVQSYSVVTAACLAVRREVFEQVNGLDPAFAVAFNDVDFCIRVRDCGYRNVWTPYAELYHYESATRGSDMAPDKRARFQREIDLMHERWGEALTRDPAYSPNLRLDGENFALAERSREPRPWLERTGASSKPARSSRSGKKQSNV